ncbi:MAG: PolC-type DNA polymerase III [Acholeplasmataceae bacterium]|jgi:DNA polymerase-3 subunit epsilon
MKYKNILVFDFETTGVNPSFDEIIEIGAIKLEKINDNYEVVDELSVLIKQDFPLPPKITEITGITDEMLAQNGVTRDVAFQMFNNLYTKDCLLIAYNIQFDIWFLINLYRKEFDKFFEIENDLLDAMAVYKDFHAYPHRLESALATYPVGVPNSHRASDDAKATYLLLKKMEAELPSRINLDTFDLTKFVNVIGQNPKYKIPLNQRLKHVTYVDHWPNQQLIYKKR